MMSLRLLLLLLVMARASVPAAPRPSEGACPNASAIANYSCPGCDLKQVLTTTAEACQAACCAEAECISFGWNSDLPVSSLAPACNQGQKGPCCWLKKCEMCAFDPKWTNCSSSPATHDYCRAAGGVSGRKPPSPPAPPPSVCPAKFLNGTDIYGGGMGNPKASSAEECCTICTETKGCGAFAYRTDRQLCYLKTGGSNPFSNPDAISGITKPPPPPPPPPVCPLGWVWGGLACVDPSSSGTPTDAPPSYDCEVRKHAWEFAKKTLPERGSFKTAFDALQLHRCANITPPTTLDSYVPPHFPTPATGTIIFVDANATGSSGDGSKTKPFSSLDAALHAAAKSEGAGVTVVLRSGVYYSSGVLLTTRHSNMTIQNFEGEHAVVSGSVPVPVAKDKWALHNMATNTWRLDLADWEALPAETFGLRGGSRRAIRARYPDGDPEIGTGVAFGHVPFIPTNSFSNPATPLQEHYSSSHDWPDVFWPEEPEGGSLPNAGESLGGTGRWSDGYGGLCSDRQAPFGYWCNPENSRSTAPNDNYPPYGSVGGFFYDPASSRIENWTHPIGAVFHIESPFATVQCLVRKVDRDNRTVHFDPSIGCDQAGVSGFRPPTFGGPFPHGWYADNIKEECNTPGEYFFDADAKALYYTFNATEQPTGDEDFSLVTTKVIFNVSGTQVNPVTGVTIRGLTIRDAALTYLGTTPADVHYIPASSDWAVQRSGAVLLEGTEYFTFESNYVTRCDGNGLFLSNYNRNASIIGNEFSWIGDSALQAFGSMSNCLNEKCSISLNYSNSGVDGRGGNQPRYTRVVGNLVREVGVYQKQSGMWAQHLTAATHIESNVFFNGPHAAVNFNDAFGGGDTVVGNLLFNTNRQTVAHGVINAWERAPYISDIGVIRNYSKDANNTKTAMPGLEQLQAGYFPGFDRAPAGVGSAVSAFRRVHKNFLMANYNALSAVTLDDGASRFLMYDNYMVYGQIGVGESCHNSQWVYGVGNLYAYVINGPFNGCCAGVSASLIASEGPSPLGIRTFFYNSTFLNLRDADWCNINEQTHLNLPQFWNNRVHSPSGKETGPTCHGGNNTLFLPMPDAEATQKASAILAPFPKAAAV